MPIEPIAKTLPAREPNAATDPNFLASRWIGGIDGSLRLLDQTRLPTEIVHCDCHDAATVWEAIKMLRVRGAPAIGVAAAYGLLLGVRSGSQEGIDGIHSRIEPTVAYLASSRPTAVNLFWALDRMKRVALANPEKDPAAFLTRLLAEAHAIEVEDVAMCRAIGRFGAELLKSGWGVLTHCNAGALATADYGTALAVFFAAHEEGKRIHVFADETRPLLQGSRLTAWELQTRGVPATLICDNMAASVMRAGKVQAAVVGADRIAANGDTANKIGTYSVAISCKHHGIPFYVAAPSSTFDFEIESGAEIPIEERDPREITHGFGRQTAPDGVNVFNPAFDVTPAELVAAFITERGVIRPPFETNLRKILLDDSV